MFNVTLDKQHAVMAYAMACRKTPVNLGRRRTASQIETWPCHQVVTREA